MKRSRWWRLVALVALAGLFAAACGDDSDSDSSATTAADSGGDGDGLVMGRILPETGSLAFLGPPQIAGFEVAIAEINAAGGVLGSDVETVTADEGDDAAVVSDGFQRLVGEGITAFVGAAASGQSQEIIQTAFDEGILQCSASNTSGDFTTQEAENAGLYFRTVPPDDEVAPIVADQITGSGAQTVAIVSRQDDYGDFFLDVIGTALEDAGAEVTARVSYDPEESNFDAVVDEATDGDPDAFMVISFDEGGPLIASLLESGVTPDQLFGGDGIFSPTLPSLVDEANPNVIDGMTVVGATGSEDFNNGPLNDALPDDAKGDFIYGGQAYDCAIVLALAAEASGSVNPTQQDAIDVSTGGTTCTTFEECKGLLDDGEDIDYDGVSGAIDLDSVGDPTGARYGIGEYQDGLLVTVDAIDVQVETEN